MPSREYHISELLMLIDDALSQPRSFGKTEAILVKLAELMRTEPVASEAVVDEIGMFFRRWLDDWDIRQRDHDYAAAITAKLADYREQLSGQSGANGER